MATVEIDGKILEAENGKMIIEVADDAGIYIPRFCYHRKLSVAANCRMCLVEVESGRKTVPACATPITNGMKVFTKSKEALRSQQAVMEFLLINHPLDCPICDQGGECELQDTSMGFGHSESRYVENKRAIHDEDIGPLISTEMTRCIYCTRCVRFGEEIAGLRELGSIGRGERSEIGTFVKHSLVSEVSGNIIDLCPVGALTSKPYRYTARAWEMSQHNSVAPHDCLGSHVLLHAYSGQIMRVVPKEASLINEVWLSDRDRFSYLGLNSPTRAVMPWIKVHGQWEEVEWSKALAFAAEGMGKLIKEHGPEQFAAFSSASATLEEMYLLAKLMRALGVHHLDHRLQQTDFSDQEHLPTAPMSSLPYAELEQQSTIFLIGVNIHREVPLAGLKIRKAFLNGAEIIALNPVDYETRFDCSQKLITSVQMIPETLAKVLLALNPKSLPSESEWQSLFASIKPDKVAKAIAKSLKAPHAVLITGAISENHPNAAAIRALVYLICQASGAKWIRLTTGSNSVGAWLAGMVPHRAAGGQVMEKPGLDVQKALDHKLKGYLLLGAEPEFDFSNPFRTRQSLMAAEFVVMISAYKNEAYLDYADVILPMAPYGETSGTYINLNQDWQQTQGVVKPKGEARPAWKILRVLGNLLHVDGFDFTSSEEVLDELKNTIHLESQRSYQLYCPKNLNNDPKTLMRIGEWPLYRCDPIVRSAHELQNCGAADLCEIRVHPETAANFKLDKFATVSQGNIEITLPLVIDERVAIDMVMVPSAMNETIDLGHAFAAINIK